MSLFGSIKKVVKKAAKKVKSTTKKVVETVADAVEQNAEAAGGAIWGPVKGFGDTIEHTFLGVWKSANGDQRGARREFQKAMHAARGIGTDILFGPPNVVLMWAVNYVSAVQQVLGIESKGRPLSDDERKYLIPIFGDTIDYDSVSIVEGNLGLLGATNAVFTIGRRIRIPTSSGYLPLSKHRHTLVHEMAHVWQFENGGVDYVLEALVAQEAGANGYWLDDDGNVAPAPRGYAFDVAVADGMHWQDFNPEQQATFIEAAFQLDVDFRNPASTPMIFNGADYSDELANALDWVRSGEGTP